MTTTVIIKAHCASAKEVKIDITTGQTGETITLQDGETHECYAYDNRRITVYERDKADLSVTPVPANVAAG